MNKKILLILGIVVVIGLAAYLVLNSGEESVGGDNNTGFSIADFLPFGKSENVTPNNTDDNTENPINSDITDSQTGNVNEPVKRIRKISSEPVAGAVVFNVGSTTLARFVEKGTGNVYEARSDTNKIERLTNTTIPKIIRAYWLPDGSGFLAQTLVPESEIIETNLVKLFKNTATTTENLTPYGTKISQLPTDIKEISIKPDGTKIFYYTIVQSGSSWHIANPDGTGSAVVGSHTLIEWLPRWVGANTIIMQTKPSSDSLGYAYSYNTSSKVLSRLGGGLSGFSSNPNADGSTLLVSSGSSLLVLDAKTGAVSSLSAQTLSDKCAWAKKEKVYAYCGIPSNFPSGNYPDSWYKGIVSTTDAVNKINSSADVYYNIMSSTEAGEPIDVYNISVSNDDSHLIFQNKKDGFLWMLRVGE